MAHFAELDIDDRVLRIIVIDNSDTSDQDGNEDEEIGRQFCFDLLGGHDWIQTSINNRIRGVFAQPGMIYCREQDKFAWELPAKPWLEVAPNGRWVTPVGINYETGEPITEQEWAYIRGWTRHTKGLGLVPAIPAAAMDEIHSTTCLAVSNFTYPAFELLEHGKSTALEVMQAQIKEGKFSSHLDIRIRRVIDMTPYAVVAGGSIPDPNWIPELGRKMQEAHPQVSARTPHEFFRLLIEWGFTYTHFGNREMAATYAHNMLRLLQMPLDVRNDLLNTVPPQCIERYILGLYPFAAQDELDDPPAPESFLTWYAQMMMQHPEKHPSEEIEPIDWDTIPESYPQ